MGIFSVLAGVVLVAGLEPSVAVAIVAGIILPILGFIATAIWRFHNRLIELEKQSQTREQVVYGGDNNPLNLGLVKEIKALKEDFEEYERKQKELQKKKDKLFERIQALEREVDDYEREKQEDEEA